MTRGNPLTVTGVRSPLWDTRMDVVEREKKRESGGDAGGDTAHTKLFSIGSIFGDSRSASRRRRLVVRTIRRIWINLFSVTDRRVFAEQPTLSRDQILRCAVARNTTGLRIAIMQYR